MPYKIGAYFEKSSIIYQQVIYELYHQTKRTMEFESLGFIKII